jgi:hypothetical protein
MKDSLTNDLVVWVALVIVIIVLAAGEAALEVDDAD